MAKEIDNTVEKINREISTLEEQEKSIKSLSDEYEKYARDNKKSDQYTKEEREKIFELQENINKTLKKSGEHIDLVVEKTDEYGRAILEVNENYDRQLAKIKAIDYEKQKQIVAEKEALVKEYQTAANLSNVERPEGLVNKQMGVSKGLVGTGVYGSLGLSSASGDVYDLTRLVASLNALDLEKRVETLKQMKQTAEDYIKSTEKVTQQEQEAYAWIANQYDKTKTAYDNLKTATDELTEAQGALEEI